MLLGINQGIFWILAWQGHFGGRIRIGFDRIGHFDYTIGLELSLCYYTCR
jgi:hypothetical protein